MTVQQLRPPVMARAVAAVLEAFDVIAGVPVGSLDRDELPDVLSDLAVLESRVGALKLEVLAEAHRRRIAEENAGTGTDAWAAKLTGTTRGVMTGGICLANLLRSTYDATRETFAAGASTRRRRGPLSAPPRTSPPWSGRTNVPGRTPAWWRRP